MKDDVYVNFMSGASGEFILGLLMTINAPLDETYITPGGTRYLNHLRNFNITETGSCHIIRTDQELEILAEFSDNWTMSNEFQQFVKHKKPYNCITKCHVPFTTVHKLWEYFPGIIINILPDKSGKQQFTNWWSKAVLGEWDRYGYGTLDGTEFKNKHWSEITLDEMNSYINRSAAKYETLHTYNQAMEAQHPRKFFSLKLEDIYNNKEKVLTLLEHITQKSRTPLTLQLYDVYLQGKKSFEEIIPK